MLYESERGGGGGNDPGPIIPCTFYLAPFTLHLLPIFIGPDDDTFTLPSLVLPLFSDVDPGEVIFEQFHRCHKNRMIGFW